MLSAPVTSLYAAILALIFVLLSVRVIGRRRASGLAIGVAGKPDLERAARVHANFAEYVPLLLMLLLLGEVASFPEWVLHMAGIALVTGRCAHALGVSRTPEDFRLRVFGMGCTLGLTLLLAIALLTHVTIGVP